jgi:hypothetical protein
MRPAGAALVDEHDVAARAELAIHDPAARRVGGRVARAAGEREDRIGRQVAAQRGHHDDAELDLATPARRPVLPDAVGAAQQLLGDTLDGARREPLADGGPRRRRRRGRAL